MKKTYLVTGGAGFIGSNFILATRLRDEARIINLDKLTYAGHPDNLASLRNDPGHVFIHGDIGDESLVRWILETHRPEAVVHFAAESHVDRSIQDPGLFLQTNVIGTFCLLEQGRRYWRRCLENGQKKNFKFIHVSTDEVYGSLGLEEPGFIEGHPYKPSSPYSASKAAGDHLARAYGRTYGLPVIVVNSSNNYGSCLFPEKLIPLMILNAYRGEPLPVYGNGQNVRDWLYVQDHCAALAMVLERGLPGETYNIGAGCEKTNLEVVRHICRALDQAATDSPYKPHARLINFVKDRPGHDLRYAVNAGKIMRELGWQPRESFESGLEKTVGWYLNNMDWVKSVGGNAGPGRIGHGNMAVFPTVEALPGVSG